MKIYKNLAFFNLKREKVKKYSLLLLVLGILSFRCVAAIDGEGERPTEHFCPISFDVMRDPVIAADGISYEREEIERWFIQSNISPATGVLLPTTAVTPNISLRNIIQDWGPNAPADIRRVERKLTTQMRKLGEEITTLKKEMTDCRTMDMVNEAAENILKQQNCFQRNCLIYFHNQTGEDLYYSGSDPAVDEPAIKQFSMKSRAEKEGRVTYSIGSSKLGIVNISWSNPFFGSNEYNATCSNPFYKIEQSGGEGLHAVVRFFFKKNKAPLPTTEYCVCK